jgi:hypothetical protein
MSNAQCEGADIPDERPIHDCLCRSYLAATKENR